MIGSGKSSPPTVYNKLEEGLEQELKLFSDTLASHPLI